MSENTTDPTNKKFTVREIYNLCVLYNEGKLSKDEENVLYGMLQNRTPLPAYCHQTLISMEVEKNVYNPALKVLKKKRSPFLKWSVAAAAVLFVAVGAGALIGDKKSDDSSYVVWKDGKKYTGQEAKEMAEDSQFTDMDMLRTVLRQQKEMMRRNYAINDIEDDF